MRTTSRTQHNQPQSGTGTMRDIDKSREQLINELVEMRQRIVESEASETERKQVGHNLRERIKELGCLYGIAGIAERPGITLDEIYQEIVKLLPQSWQYPEIAYAQLTIDGKEFKTANYRETEWKQFADIKVHGIKAGMVVVGYLEERPASEGPFLKEERSLIDAVAERLGRITERKRVEGAFRKSEAEYKRLMENLEELIYSCDPETFVATYVNRSIERICGYTVEEWLNVPRLWENSIHPDDKEMVFAGLAEAQIKKQPYVHEYRIIRKDQTIRWVRDHFSWGKDQQGNTVSINGMMYDITERKRIQDALIESEERYRDLFENASDLIQSVAPDGHFVYVNKAWREILGYSEEEEANLTLWDIIHPDSIPHCQEIFQKVVSGEAVSNIEAIFVAKDGKLVSVEGNANCRFKGGKLVSTRAIFHNITERKQAEQVQERLNQQLQTKVSELETFSYAVAHDLRSPLVSIEGFVGLLQGDIHAQDTERIGEDIRLINSGVRKMGQLLEKTLEYSHSGHLAKPVEDIPFGEIVEEALGQFAERVRSIGATISLAETFPSVYVDRMMIRRVLTNLIQNSVNYRDKTRLLTIEIGYRLSEGEAVFFVRDNGIGIDASEAGKVFELFYRGTADSEGSGAGLAIVKRIIEAREGRIWIEGQLGEGTTVCFTLPR